MRLSRAILRGRALCVRTITVVLCLLPMVAALALWAVLLTRVDLHHMNDLGLISVLPPEMCAAAAVLIVSFCLALHRGAPVPLLLLHVVGLVLMIHATPAILYGTVRYAWSWKHIGIIDYIQRYGAVNPGIPNLTAYHDWPGFFAVGALLTQALGFKSAADLAVWAPPFFSLIDIGALYLIYSALTDDRRLVWLSIWFFFLTNMIGQEYFSPQAMAYFLHLVVLGICLTWFWVRKRPSTAGFKGRPIVGLAVRAFRMLTVDLREHSFTRPGSAEGSIESRGAMIQRTGVLIVVIILFAAIVSSHQLTPFMTIVSVMALVLVRRCRLRTLPLLLVAITTAWIVNMAVAFLNGNLPWIVQSIGRVDTNTNLSSVNVGEASPGLQLVILVGRVLVVTVVSAAVLGWIRRLRAGYWDVSCMVLAAAPVPMLVLNSYGGEMLFRVYFFSLPFLAFFAASLLYPDSGRGTSWRTPLIAAIASCVLLAGFCFPYYGKERMYYYSHDETAAAQYVADIAPAGSLMLCADDACPTMFRDYELYSYRYLLPVAAPSLKLAEQSRTELLSDPSAYISMVAQSVPHTSVYLSITRSQQATSDESGYLPVGSLERITQALRHSRLFRLVYANADATVFTVVQTK